MTRFYPVAVVLLIAIFAVAILATGGTLLLFISTEALLLVLAPSLVLALGTHNLREIGRCFAIGFPGSVPDRHDLEVAEAFFRALGRYLTGSGVAGFLLGAIVMLANLYGDASTIGTGTAVALLTVFYAILLVIAVPVPYLAGIRRRQADLERSG